MKWIALAIKIKLMKLFIFTAVSFISLIALYAFKQPKKAIVSLKDMKKVLKAGYCYVPSGSLIMNGDTVSCQGFFMRNTEVTNFDYKEYLYQLKNKGDLDAYKKALPDSTKWINQVSGGEKMKDHYFSHPVYNYYPVVNLTYEQAEAYCDWLSEVWQQNTGNKSIRFRLPLQAEFLKAAYGTDLERPYSWKGPYLRDNKGLFMANFIHVGEGAITRGKDGKLEVKTSQIFNGYNCTDLMAAAKSYSPNELGLYNLNGNVAEMVAEKGKAVGGSWNSPGYDIRNTSVEEFTTANPKVGFRPVMTFVGK